MLRHFDVGALLGATVALVAVVAAVVRSLRAGPGERRDTALRTLAVGTLATVLVASVGSRGGLTPGYHQAALRLGDGGLGRISVLAVDPTSTEALQLLLNVLVYVPLALLVALAWDDDGFGPWRGVAVAASTSIAVELAQWQLTTRLAATDDVVLNTLGGCLGAVLALAVARSGLLDRRRVPTG